MKEVKKERLLCSRLPAVYQMVQFAVKGNQPDFSMSRFNTNFVFNYCKNYGE